MADRSAKRSHSEIDSDSEGDVPPFDASQCVIFSSASGQYFADLLAARLGICQRKIFRKYFGDGEEYYRLEIDGWTDLTDMNAIYVSTTASDHDLLELVRVGNCLAELGTKRRIFVIPFYGYSTMERSVLPGEIVTAKVSAKMLSSIPNSGYGNIFLMLDLHVQGLLHYFEGPCTRLELYAESPLVEGLEALQLENFMFASADLGRPKWVQTFALRFGTALAFIRKNRNFDQTLVDDVIGDVMGKNVVIYDDMTRSANTLINAAKAYLERGALKVYAVLSHLAINSESVAQKLIDSPIEKIVCTNSHPQSQGKVVQESSKFIVVDVAPVFDKCIGGFLRSG